MPSGSLLTSLGEGSHNLTIRAIDTAGNTGKCTIMFSVDTIAPIITITNPTNNTFGLGSVTLSYSVSEGQTTVYLDNLANTTSRPSGSLLSSLSEGSHNLTIRSIDLAGNIGKDTVLFTVDTIAPIITITNPTNNTFGLDSVTLIYSVSEGQTTVYLDNAANSTSRPSGSLLSSLSEGSHNLTIRSIDLAGKIGKETVLFTIDTISPSVTITSPTNNTYAQNDVTLTYSVSGGVVSIYIDGNVNTTALPSGSLLSSLSEGSHNLTIRSIDLAGNIRKETVIFTVDTLNPIVTITSPINTSYRQDSIILTYSVTEGLVTVYLDGIANTTTISSGTTLSSLADGSHNITITAIDTVSNIGNAMIIFTVDATAPIITIISPTNSTYAQNSLTLSYTVSGGKITVYLDGNANITALPSGSTLFNLVDGSHNLTVVAEDAVGNTGKATILFTVSASTTTTIPTTTPMTTTPTATTTTSPTTTTTTTTPTTTSLTTTEEEISVTTRTSSPGYTLIPVLIMIASILIVKRSLNKRKRTS